ncbi:MAG: TerC family protein [Methanotrichaceae archaeon]|nr:TerC family protein [Methanotrichaceae archaeon]
MWIVFCLTVLILLALDLGVFHRKSQQIAVKEAMIWSIIWIAVAAIFNVLVYFWHGQETAVEFAAAYIVERTLSVDNLFVFLLIFSYFKVPAHYHYRVLFWGILAALVLRALFIISGIALIQTFHWVIYLFGAFLIFTGIKIALKKDDDIGDMSQNPVLGLCKRFIPTLERYDGDKFFSRMDGRTLATPLFLVLVVVETSDLIFALDSVPAVLAITIDPFVAYSSNIFAVLGLRALYFALAGCMLMFRYLNSGITIILIFVGAKMLISGFYEVPVSLALGVITLVLTASVVLSLLWPEDKSSTQSKPQIK